MLTPAQEARLWAHIEKREPDQCWHWLAATPAGLTQLGRQYGVAPATVRDVKSGKNWKDVA